MDELNNYVVMGLEHYNVMRDEVAVSRHIIATFERELAEKDELIKQLSDQILLLQEHISDDFEEEALEQAG